MYKLKEERIFKNKITIFKDEKGLYRKRAADLSIDAHRSEDVDFSGLLFVDSNNCMALLLVGVLLVSSLQEQL